jgi:hypothetical protein
MKPLDNGPGVFETRPRSIVITSAIASAGLGARHK